MCFPDGAPVEVQTQRWAARQWFVLGSSFVVVAYLISSHVTMEQPLQIMIFNGNSFAMVAREGSTESPWHL